MSEKLKGTGVALATPMFKNGDIDFDSLSKLVSYVIEGGVDYLVVLGTTGEAPALYPEERNQILDCVAEVNKGRLPLVLGFSGNFTHNLISKISSLNDDRLDALLISSPHYNKPSQEGIIAHFKAVADVSDYPIILYNVPHRTASNMTSGTTIELSKHDTIVGIKEASGDLDQCMEIVNNTADDFLMISGDDGMNESIMSIGGVGSISVIANAFPKTTSASISAYSQSTTYFNDSLSKAIELSGEEGNPTSIKAALYAKEICAPHLRLPMTSPSDSLVEAFRSLDLKT